MDFSKFIQFPGVLVLVGVVLLIIAMIISISSAIKNKKNKGNINQPATFSNDVSPQPMEMEQGFNMMNNNTTPDMNQNNNVMANSNPTNPMFDNPMGVPTNNGPMPGTANDNLMASNGQAPNLMGNNNSMGGMPPFVNPEEAPMISPIPEVTPVTPVMPEPVVEEKKEPITNPWANASTAYGGANPMDGVNLNFNNGPQEPYGEKNFTASPTPTINPMETSAVNPMEPPKSDDVETL